MKLSELKFGQIVYDILGSQDNNRFFGEKGVYCGFKNGVHTITWEESGTNTHSEDSELTISLEPPKRKVTHTLERYVSNGALRHLLTQDDVTISIFSYCGIFNNKITITFETEE